jgi:hypothetical protein
MQHFIQETNQHTTALSSMVPLAHSRTRNATPSGRMLTTLHLNFFYATSCSSALCNKVTLKAALISVLQLPIRFVPNGRWMLHTTMPPMIMTPLTTRTESIAMGECPQL